MGKGTQHVSVVEPPVSRSYGQRARVALWVVGPVVGLAAGAVVPLVRPGTPPAVAVAAATVLGAVCGLAVAVLVRAWPVLRVLWHWSLEILAVAGLALGLPALIASTGPLPVLASACVLVGAVLVTPRLRRWVAAWWWCAIVRHRLRLCFAEFIRSANRVRPGSHPLILLARPTPAGERVWIWLRPGLDLTALEGRAGQVAVACWASEVRLCRASARYAALLRVDVTRRDPLTVVVGAPLAGVFETTPLPAVSALVARPVGLDLVDVPEEPPVPARVLRRAG